LAIASLPELSRTATLTLRESIERAVPRVTAEFLNFRVNRKFAGFWKASRAKVPYFPRCQPKGRDNEGDLCNWQSRCAAAFQKSKNHPSGVRKPIATGSRMPQPARIGLN
jgi:hypothetical protein